MGDAVIEVDGIPEERQKMIKHFHHARSSIIDFKAQILEKVLNNAKEEIEEIVKYYTEDLENHPEDGLMKYRYKTHSKKTILIIACTEKNVTPETLDVLCSAIKARYNKIDYIDDLYYGWEPIHYVAKCADVEKLEVILKQIPESTNSLTYFSENPLHILLQYKKSVSPFEVILHNGIEPKLTTIIGPEPKDIVTCADLLITSGADVNHTNFWNETPICLAVRYRYTQLVQLLLKIDYLDIDTCTESGKTIREYLKLNLFTDLPQSYVQEDPTVIKFNLLKAGDVERFIQYNAESIMNNTNYFDGYDDYTTCGNMLQLCMRKGFLEYLHDERSKLKRLTNYDINDTPMLTIFKSKGYLKCIIYLLDNGADPFKTSRKFPTNLLEYASLRGYYPFVAVLMQHKYSKINSNGIFPVLSKMYNKYKMPLNNYDFYRYCVLYLLLNRLVYLVRLNQETLTAKRRAILNKLLHHLNLEANDKRVDDSEIICQVLHLGASLTSIDETKNHNHDVSNGINVTFNKESNNITIKENKMAIERINQHILKMHLDDSINGRKFKYDTIIQDDEVVYNENRTLHFLAKDEHKKHLLCHPLLIQLVKNKWYKVRWFFYADLIFYALLLINIYAYMISLRFNYFYTFLNWFYYFSIGFHVIKEGLQLFFLYRWKYFLDLSNILEVTTIISCLWTIMYPNIYTSILAMLFSTFIFFVMLGQLPFFTKYTIIFSSIKYFFQYTGFYFILFVCFALCFYIVAPFEDSKDKSPDWGGMFKSLFYTLIFFTGEFHENVLEPIDYPIFGRIIMTIFIIAMTIILNNLLVGLIVADMDKIQKTSRLHKQIKLVSFIKSTNTFAKRLHTFKYMDFVKRIINQVNIFHKGKPKILKYVDLNHFDDDNKAYLREIKKYQPFKRHMLRDLYLSLKE
ncbi:uncharacterized protein [Diabrotica undecimpunctata]|uniref:uncharacterized protein n=1 Tax=Diabrotica undecimpunctata TaxID=50387 RepID=UPI003B63DBC3